MTDGMGFVELLIVAVMVAVPVIAVVLLFRALLRALARRGAANGELASLRERVDRLEADRARDTMPRDRSSGA